MKVILILISSIYFGVCFCQSNGLKKSEDYLKIYEPLIDSIFEGVNRIHLYQNQSWVMSKHHFKEIDASTYDYLRVNYKIDSSLFLNLYENWLLNITKKTADNFDKGISTNRMKRILAKGRKRAYNIENRPNLKKNYVISISPPFWLNQSIVMVQIKNYCNGFCNSVKIYFLKLDKIKGIYVCQLSDGIFMQ